MPHLTTSRSGPGANNNEVFVLESLNAAACDVPQARYMQHNGVLYAHDPRIVLTENTLASPASSSVSSLAALGQGLCTSVPKTFVNKVTALPYLRP